MDADDDGMVQIQYDGSPNGMAFKVGDRRAQTITIGNRSATQCVMFKIQCTSSRRFRVRPAMALVQPQTYVSVQVQLAVHDNDSCACKFLVVVRAVQLVEEVEGEMTRRASSVIHERSESRDEKFVWQRAEALHEASLVVAKEIHIRVHSEADMHSAHSTQTLEDSSDSADAPMQRVRIPSDKDGAVVFPVDTVEMQSQLVVLLMKNQSRLPSNKLTPAELDTLRMLKHRRPSDWDRLTAYATRMRALLRQYCRQQRHATVEAMAAFSNP